MIRSYTTLTAFVFLAIALAVAAPGARACDTPVFRYALENWAAAPYGVYLLHRGPLAGGAAEAAALLRASATAYTDTDATSKGATANFIPVEIDLATTSGQTAMGKVCAREPATLPWLLAFAPERREPGKEIWSGPLNLATARRLVDSPQRREIARRLIGGDSAVWIMLESGNKKQDEKTAAALKSDLEEAARQCQAAMQEAIQAAVQAAPGDQATSSSLPVLPVRFSVLRVARGDAAEAPLAGMLLGSDPELIKVKEPIVFAVIGRGHMMPALSGEEIRHENILAACGFITGNCTCTIKDEVPGIDLLLQAEWEKAFETGKLSSTEPRPALTGFAGFTDTNEEKRP